MKYQKVGKGSKGEAKVRVKGDKVQILFKESDNPITILKDNCPDYIVNGTFFVSLSSEDDEVVSCHPMIGQFKVKFVKFAAREGEVPTPKSNPGGARKTRDGRTYEKKPFMSFSPVLQIVEGPYSGMQAAGFLEYMFTEMDGEAMIRGSGRSYDQLMGFLDCTGMLKETIKFSDNLLPKLQKRILQLAKEFNVTFKDGYVQDFIPLEDEDEDLEDEDEEVPTPKASSKVAPKKKFQEITEEDAPEDEWVESSDDE